MKVLFLCAHPDDLEFSIPGLMITLAGNPEIPKNLDSKKIYELIEKGKKFLSNNPRELDVKVKTACMSRGEMSSFTQIVKSMKKASIIRSNELNKSQKILCNAKPDFLGYIDGFIKIDEHTIESIKQYFMKIQPDIVIAPEPIYGWYHHKDHVRTGKIAFYAIRRMLRQEFKGKIPKLFYFQSIWNDWYFPRYRKFSKIISNALNAHKSQSDLLFLAQLPGFIEKIIHGRNVNGCLFGEALRYQRIPKNKEKSPKKKLPILKRIIYYMTYKGFNSANTSYYSERMKFNDEKIGSLITDIWY